ncbi:DsrE family protein [Bacteroides sp.]|uniref:DsrE family protein n=1 Tax=Bacteroides sp. TaxID=29523 RepID=UPI0025C4F4FC|nr:DsrE family protein [Bacteroides sp.]
MEKLNFVFLIREEGHWEQLFGYITNLNKVSGAVGKIAVVTAGTALLSCLKSTRLDILKTTLSRLANENVTFYLCTNTLSRYGISEDLILPEFNIALEGGLLEAARFEAMGYHMITLG